jgi:hypothetical protein
MSPLHMLQQDAYAAVAENRPSRGIGLAYTVKLGTVINERGYGGGCNLFSHISPKES